MIRAPRLELTEDEALVLFDFLRRFDDEGSLTIKDQAEECTLWNLRSRLGNQVVLTSDPDCKKTLRACATLAA